MPYDSRILFENLTEGDPAAAREIYERYAVRLIAFARQMLANSLRRRVDPEDIVQSAYRSFYINAAAGKFALHNSGDLWRLLAAITRNKLRSEVEKQTAAKRTPYRETTGLEIAQEELQADEVLAVSEELRDALGKLDCTDRRLLELRLTDASAEEMAAALGKSPRTIRRLLLELRHRLERQMQASATLKAPIHWPDPLLALDYRAFQLEQMIGAGGFGKVYRARWLSEDRTVAVKSLRKQFLIDARAVESFLREAKIIAKLEHPGIIRCNGAGRTPGGGFFLVLDWQPGGSLADRTTFTIEQALHFTRQAAEAIAYVHAAGVLHCDLKPSNLLVASDGRIVITDFGFAVANERSIADTQPLGGTLGFLSPEIQRGEVVPASDVYSLGRILRWLLERVPESGPNPEMRQQLLSLCDACELMQPDRRPTAQQLTDALPGLA